METIFCAAYRDDVQIDFVLWHQKAILRNGSNMHGGVMLLIGHAMGGPLPRRLDLNTETDRRY
eukprot:3153577-Pyramimonas_sp.AAC.1